MSSILKNKSNKCFLDLTWFYKNKNKYLNIRIVTIASCRQGQQHSGRDRHDVLGGVLVVRRRAQRGAAAGRRGRGGHGRQQARLRAPVRGAPLHARRRAPVAGAAARPGRPGAAAPAAPPRPARPAAAAGRPRRPGPGRLAPPHAPQARGARRAARGLVLGAGGGLRRRHARAPAAVRDGLAPRAARRLPRAAGLHGRRRAAPLHAAPGGGRVARLAAQGAHVLQPPRPAALPDQAEAARQTEAGRSGDGRVRRRVILDVLYVCIFYL